MRVAILGTGSIGLSYAALLAASGHEPVLFSPSGSGTARLAAGEMLEASGAVEGAFRVDTASDCAGAVRGSELVVVAVPAYGHRAVLDALAPALSPGQAVAISSHYSLSALYLSRLLAERGVAAPVGAWSTTVATGRKTADAAVAVSGLRKRVDVAALPQSEGGTILGSCIEAFGARFAPAEDLLAVALSNLNPPAHMANALCNFTRIEKGEAWSNYDGITASVGRLIEALDAERLAVAKAYGVGVRSVFEHYRLSYPQAEGETVAEMSAAIHRARNGPPGPATTGTRFVLEDVPFGLVPLAALADAAGVPVPLHEAGIALFSALYGRDFGKENDLLAPLGLEGRGGAEIHALLRGGWRA